MNVQDKIFFVGKELFLRDILNILSMKVFFMNYLLHNVTKYCSHYLIISSNTVNNNSIELFSCFLTKCTSFEDHWQVSRPIDAIETREFP